MSSIPPPSCASSNSNNTIISKPYLMGLMRSRMTVISAFLLLLCGALVYGGWMDISWRHEIRKGFQNSNLASQCTYRYKVYVEGRSWSVSQKYILACDSVALRVTPRFHEFFTRGLFPLEHYWPIKSRGKCPAIKFAVDWGNANQDKAQAIGRSASNFIKEELSMDHVYDYMFHLLNEYSKLLRFKPKIPPNAVEVCEDSMMCTAEGLDLKFMADSMVNASDVPPSPCTLPPAYSVKEMRSLMERKEMAIRQVDSWERKWMKHNFTF